MSGKLAVGLANFFRAPICYRAHRAVLPAIAWHLVYTPNMKFSDMPETATYKLSAFHLIFVINSPDICIKYEFQAASLHFISKLSMVLDSPFMIPTKAQSLNYLPCLVKRGMYINTFQTVDGGYLGFLIVEALSVIFELDIQQIWVQHPLIPQKLVGLHTRFACSTLNMHISPILCLYGSV